MNLLDLPSELVLHCLDSLDSFSSLRSFALTCRGAHELVGSSSSLLHRRLCFNLGFTEWTSCGSSTGVGVGWQGELSGTFDPDELRRAIERQRSMSTYFQHVDTWEQLARKRLALARAWREGNCQPRSIRFELPTHAIDAGIHRFKLDPDGPLLLATGVEGGYYAFDLDGELVWSCSLPHSNFPHVELSDGYFSLMTSEWGERYSIWRRGDITTPSPSISASLVSELVAHSDLSRGPGYVPVAELVAPTGMNATKMRFPYFLGSSHHRRVLYRFDLTRQNELTEIDISQLWEPSTLEGGGMNDPSIYYVEILDSHHVVVGGAKSITVWHPEKRLVATFPPPPPLRTEVEVQVHPRAHYRANNKRPRWSAVHHDARHGHLVATSYGERGVTGSGKLMWIPKWIKLVDGSSEVEQMTVVLQTNAAIIQLAVENERAVFVTQDHSANMCALWVINLRAFTSLEDFKKAPPVPICLSFPLPCIVPPSRVEMTLDEIFVPFCSLFHPLHGESPSTTTTTTVNDDGVNGAFSRWYAEVQELARTVKGGPVDMRWESLNAEVLWEGFEKEEGRERVLREVERQWRDVLAEADGRTDGLVSFAFGPNGKN